MALTKADKKWAEEKFVTKGEAKNFATKDDLVATRVKLGLEFDKKMDGLKDEMNQRLDEVMTTLDAIMKEVSTGREHDLVMNHQQEVQDKRLEVLEEVVGVGV